MSWFNSFISHPGDKYHVIRELHICLYFFPQRKTHCDQLYYNKGINQGLLGGGERLFALRQLTVPVNIFSGAPVNVLVKVVGG